MVVTYKITVKISGYFCCGRNQSQGTKINQQ